MLAPRGETQAQLQWRPLVEYLAQKLGNGAVELVSLDFGHVEPAVRDRLVDFVLANPSYYVLLEERYGVSRIATLRNRSTRGGQTRFSSVLLREEGRQSLQQFSDLRDLHVGAVDPRSLGGYQIIAGEAQQAGFDLANDTAGLHWMHTHDEVLKAVMAGEVDAGIVRSDTIERMVAEGHIVAEAVGVIMPRPGDDFPFLHSADLYPEWPFAALAHVAPDMRRRVAMSLLTMPEDHPAALAADITGWDLPGNYQVVHRLLERL